MRYLLIILWLATSIPGACQFNPSDSSARCFANWKMGETKHLSIIRAKETGKSGKPSDNNIFSYEAEIVVLDSTSEGYKMKWTFHLPKAFKKRNPGIADSLPVFEGMEMVFTTSASGVFKELLNWEEVKDTYVKMMIISLPKNLDNEARAAIEKSEALFNSKEVVESTLINEILIYHFPFGNEFSTREIRTNIELKSPFGDEPLPAFQSYQITSLDPNEDVFKLVARQEIDQLEAEVVLGKFFKMMKIPEDSLMSEVKEAMAGMEISERREYTIGKSTGWIKKISYRKVTKTRDVSQTDAYQIRMID